MEATPLRLSRIRHAANGAIYRFHIEEIALRIFDWFSDMVYRCVYRVLTYCDDTLSACTTSNWPAGYESCSPAHEASWFYCLYQQTLPPFCSNAFICHDAAWQMNTPREETFIDIFWGLVPRFSWWYWLALWCVFVWSRSRIYSFTFASPPRKAKPIRSFSAKSNVLPKRIEIVFRQLNDYFRCFII